MSGPIISDMIPIMLMCSQGISLGTQLLLVSRMPSGRYGIWQIEWSFPETAAAVQNNIPLIMFETNTASCAGFPGVSDSFGAALWAVGAHASIFGISAP